MKKHLYSIRNAGLTAAVVLGLVQCHPLYNYERMQEFCNMYQALPANAAVGQQQMLATQGDSIFQDWGVGKQVAKKTPGYVPFLNSYIRLKNRLGQDTTEAETELVRVDPMAYKIYLAEQNSRAMAPKQLPVAAAPVSETPKTEAKQKKKKTTRNQNGTGRTQESKTKQPTPQPEPSAQPKEGEVRTVKGKRQIFLNGVWQNFD